MINDFKGSSNFKMYFIGDLYVYQLSTYVIWPI